MAIFTFSTKSSRPGDTEIVQRIKIACIENHMNFSGLIVDLLRKYEIEQAKEAAAKEKRNGAV